MLQRKRSYEDPVGRALAAQFGIMRVNSAKILRAPAVEPLHDLRIAALRAGFVLKFCKSSISTGHIGKLRDQLADARRIMGKQRDLDIFSLRMEKDCEVLNISPHEKQKLQALFGARKTKARNELAALLRSVRYKSILKGLEHAALAGNSKRLNTRKLLKDVIKEVECSTTHSRRLHKIRMAIKNLRYACEFFVDFEKEKKLRQTVERIIEVQDVLGEHEDAENAVVLLGRLKKKTGRKGLGRLIKIEKKHAHDAHRKFVKMGPINGTGNLINAV